MARKNTVKQFEPEKYYHLYNRGVDKRDIFLDPQDYHTFLSYLKAYLAPFTSATKPGFKGDKPSIVLHKQNMNLNSQVQLVSYCLLPNHFHLLVKQTHPQGITQLMRRVCVNYSMYFNRKYDRSGSLFESIYKAALVDNDSQLLHLTRYIHLNPLSLKVSRFGPVSTVTSARPHEYEYSSYSLYFKAQTLPWFDPRPILAIFTNSGSKYRSYQDFVEDYHLSSQATLGPLVLEEEPEKR